MHQDADGENVERGQGEMLSPETEKLDGTDDAFHERDPLGQRCFLADGSRDATQGFARALHLCPGRDNQFGRYAVLESACHAMNYQLSTQVVGFSH